MSPRPLTVARKGAPKGSATSAVIFVHGYGANGADLLALAGPMAPNLPNTAFYAPDAADPCPGVPGGFQWFSIPNMDGSSAAAARKGLLQAEKDLNALIDRVMVDEGLPPSAIALVGFSQGTMLSLQVAPRRAEPLGAVVGFSGRLLNPETLAAETVSKPPVFLIHGDADPMVPIDHLPEADAALTDAGFEFYGFACKGLGHSIDGEGLSLALGFLAEMLPK